MGMEKETATGMETTLVTVSDRSHVHEVSSIDSTKRNISSPSFYVAYNLNYFTYVLLIQTSISLNVQCVKKPKQYCTKHSNILAYVQTYRYICIYGCERELIIIQNRIQNALNQQAHAMAFAKRTALRLDEATYLNYFIDLYTLLITILIKVNLTKLSTLFFVIWANIVSSLVKHKFKRNCIFLLDLPVLCSIE